MIADLVRDVGGPHVEVTGLIGPGVDLHLYRAKTSDLAKLRRAGIVFYNGLLLEGRMTDVLVRLAKDKPVIAVSKRPDESELLAPAAFAGHHDPHIWFDVTLWIKAAQTVGAGLSTFDPAHVKDDGADTQRVREKYEQAGAYVKRRAAEVPETPGLLITSHDACNCFGRTHEVFRPDLLQKTYGGRNRRDGRVRRPPLDAVGGDEF